MDVRLPNGKVMKNVPQGTNKWKIVEVAISRGIATPEDFGQESASPTAGIGGLQRLREGVGQGISAVGRQLGNVVGLKSDEDIETAKGIDAPLLATTAGRVGSMIGETAAYAPLGLGVGGAIGRAGSVGARMASNPFSRGVIEGAGQGSLMAGPGNRLEGALVGGTAGAVLPTVGYGYRAARSGVRPTGAAQRLMRAGVDLTPGQMNPSGVFNKLEQTYESVPFVGNAIRGARNRAQEQFQRNVVQEGAAPGTQILQRRDVNSMLDQDEQSFKPLYDQSRGFPVNAAIFARSVGMPAGTKVHPAQALTKMVDTAVNSWSVRATNSSREFAKKFLTDQLTAIRRKQVKTDDLLALRSAIRTGVRTESLVGKGDADEVASLLRQVEKQLTGAIEKQIPPKAAAALRAADQRWRSFKPIQDAVYRGGDQPQGFSPAQLSQAVRASTPKNVYARGGGGPLRNLSSAGREVFTPTEPKTGLLGIGTGLSTGAAMYAAPQVAIPAALAAAGMIGTQSGRRLAAGVTTPQQVLRMLERSTRRNVPTPARNVLARYGRGGAVALANASRNQPVRR